MCLLVEKRDRTPGARRQVNRRDGGDGLVHGSLERRMGILRKGSGRVNLRGDDSVPTGGAQQISYHGTGEAATHPPRHTVTFLWSRRQEPDA